MEKKVKLVELIEEVKKAAGKLGRAPTTKEFGFFSQAIYRFGSWNNFLKSAGLTPNLTQNNFDNLTNEQLLEIVGKELDRIGSTRAADYNKYKTNIAPSLTHIKRRTGLKWNEILTLLDKKLNQKYLTDNELLQQLKNVAQRLGKAPSKRQLEKFGINTNIYSIKFGSYNKALELAGLDINFEASPVVHTDEELLEMYIDLCKKLGRAATSKDIDKYLPYNWDSFAMRFGGLNNLRELAGYEKHPNRNKFTKNEIIRKLKSAYRKEGRRLKNDELSLLSKSDTSFPSINTICRHFKTTKMSEVWEEIEKEVIE